MKIGLLLSPLPVAALLLMPPTPVTDPIAGGITTEERACNVAGARLGHETVRVPWTRIGTVHGDIDALYCVLRGDANAPLDFARDAERVRFTLVGRGEQPKRGTYSFEVRTSAGRTLELGPAAIQVEPRNRRSCRVEICEAFTDPGERVETVHVHTH